jgi:hypothetical protein
LTSAKATSIKAADKILDNFTKRERETLEAYYSKKLSIRVGRSTSSKTLGIISDLHVGSKFGLYSGYGPIKISQDQIKLRDHWLDCIDQIGRVNLLLLNGDALDGGNPKQNAYQLWSGDLNDQITDCERLLNEWNYDKLLLTKGSGYHIQQGQTSYEETLGARIGSVRYSQMFDDALNSYNDKKGRVILQDSGSYDGISYNGKHVNHYVFFEIHDKLFNATHHIGFSKWQAYRPGAISRELADLQGFGRGRYYDIDKNLSVIIRSHCHYFVHVEDAYGHGLTSPAFKFPDQHLYRQGLGGTYPDIGAVQIIVETNGSLEVKKYLLPKDKMPRPQVIKI